MKRRSYLKAVILSACAASVEAQPKRRHIQLHVDLSVDPAKEQEMLHNFHTSFRPAAAKQPGFVDLKMLKLRSTLAGTAPASSNYRFELIFETEEQRKAWVATPTHKKLWPTIENTLTSKNYNVILYDEA